MTAEQVIQWKQSREIARAIENPEDRRIALEKVYDQRDDLQMECIQHQADRIKKCLLKDEKMEQELDEVKSEIAEVKNEMKPLKESDRELREAKIEARGMKRLLSWVKLGCSCGLGGAIVYILQQWSTH